MPVFGPDALIPVLQSAKGGCKWKLGTVAPGKCGESELTCLGLPEDQRTYFSYQMWWTEFADAVPRKEAG